MNGYSTQFRHYPENDNGLANYLPPLQPTNSQENEHHSSAEAIFSPVESNPLFILVDHKTMEKRLVRWTEGKSMSCITKEHFLIKGEAWPIRFSVVMGITLFINYHSSFQWLSNRSQFSRFTVLRSQSSDQIKTFNLLTR